MELIVKISAAFLGLSALIVIVTVLMQEGSTQGLGAISGGAETFFGKNKAKSFEGKLALATKISAGVFIALSLLIAAIMPTLPVA